MDALLSGAGNQISTAVLDALDMLLVKDNVVIVKMSPVISFLGPYASELLGPFIDKGFVEVVYGKEEVGSYLCQHPLTKAIHLTGSSSTFNKIVWGAVSPKVHSAQSGTTCWFHPPQCILL